MNTSTTLRLAALVAAAGLTLTACAATPAPTPPAASQGVAEASTVVTITDA